MRVHTCRWDVGLGYRHGVRANINMFGGHIDGAGCHSNMLGVSMSTEHISEFGCHINLLE